MYRSQTSSRPFSLFKWVQMPAADSCLMEASDNGRQQSREMSGRLRGCGGGERDAQGQEAPMRPAQISVRQLHTACPPGAPPAPQLVQRAAALGPYREAIPPAHTCTSHTHTWMCNRIVWASAIYMWLHCKYMKLCQRFNFLSIKHRPDTECFYSSYTESAKWSLLNDCLLFNTL